ncbi:hypothetical protein [Longivirga aurantiaca]|uniref:Uncharacterized protein n=1 Tax=Longivirga aurantiaca TaxID=1837743 RepID=A0ABW1SY57_9ACTN
MADSDGSTGSESIDGAPPISWESPTSMSPLETLHGGGSPDVLPAAEPRAPRSRRPWLVGTALGVVLLLIVGGVAAAVLLNRPDVKLQRALSATTDRPSGSMTVSVRVADIGDAAAQEMLDNGAVRVAWDKGSDTQQYVLLMNGEAAVDLVVAPESLVVAQNLTALGMPEVESLLDSMTELGTTMGPDGEAFVKFAEGSPLRIATGPDSAFGKLMKETESLGGSQPKPDDAKVQALADKIQQSVRDHVTVTEQGSDDNGDHLRATVPIKAVVADVIPAVEDLVGESAPDDALSEIPGDPQLVVDVWVKDGVVTRMEIPLGELARQTGDGSAPDMTLVVEMSEQGVTMPSGTIVDLPDSLFDDLGGGLLGGGLLGSGTGGLDSSGDTGFGVDPMLDSGL